MRYYEYHHVVSFEETNLMGNVYYTNHLLWQGRCREFFLREHAPDVISELGRNLNLATVKCSCEYFAELVAFDEVVVRMRLVELALNRIHLSFEFWRGVELVARGEQQIACVGHHNATPVPVPLSLRTALEAYSQ